MSSAASTGARPTSTVEDTQSAVGSVATESNVDAIANNGNVTKGPGTRRPDDVAIKQQRMKSWQPLLNPRYVVAAYFIIGIVFIPTGLVIRNKSNNLVELTTMYESHLKNGPAADITGCEIGENPNKMYLNNSETCEIQMVATGDMDPPIMVHYELYNFYQNYRRYTTSKDLSQLLGSLNQDSVSALYCEPLNIMGGIRINPCGLVANTLFNDVITLDSIIGPDGEPINAPLVEQGIAWRSDLEWKFAQPEGFASEECSSCDACDCGELNAQGERAWSCNEPYVDGDGVCWRYFYPQDNTTQYLYETYPMVVSPLEGVTNEHFIVWMRTAALPRFRKLYGYIEQPIPAGSTLTFRVQANFAVERLKGAKALVVGNTYIFGGKNPWLGLLFLVVGVIAAVLGSLFLLKDVLSPRRLADKRYLSYKED
mmetsp:Transcript_23594/g.48843  ORF Transcript_23594/g.48843 Transcript_23594/m.48843 type:complete len:426 (-) Transcript_23594:259-1536(-)|eukprot:CAMPEP_0171336122 /NCGR_PEP_ID=MMETSP0878-20121228/5801_1 /TAXON_ID=67004 /ORGANISM="Thalassiosira weissflogii, Strain CCMP1336" /LENGTH=425 /DNA_ID=CAMNT_0011837515 /DNA_START=28 /DNA_END=1305 /DNA_ORIENTATION=+